MTTPTAASAAADPKPWSPNFIEYLFLLQHQHGVLTHGHAATGRWAKALMMLQSIISLTVLALLAARAVNIL